MPQVNPWGVESSELIEETGWANFDNFDSKLSIDSEKKSEPFVATFPDLVQTPTPNLAEETIHVQKISLEGNLNDPKASGDEITINSTETNLTTENIEKITTTSVDSVNTPDSNANPVTNR